MVRLVVIALLGLLPIGCGALRQFPKHTTLPVTKDKDNNPVLDKIYEEVQTDKTKEVQTDKTKEAQTDETKEDIRNEAIERSIVAIDDKFAKFLLKFIREKVGIDVFTGFAEVGLGAAGSLTTGGSTSRILSAISATLTGGKAALDNATLFQRTMFALVEEMIATRADILIHIRLGMELGYNQYPYIAALEDLRKYEFAGSIPGAIVAISSDAERKLMSAADKEYELTHEYDAVEDEAGELISAFWHCNDDKSSEGNESSDNDNKSCPEDNESNESRIKCCMKQSRIEHVGITTLIRARKYQIQRKDVVKCLGITPLTACPQKSTSQEKSTSQGGT